MQKSLGGIAIRDVRFASYALSVFAVILVFSAVPARADTIIQTFSETSLEQAPGINPFNPAIGVLESVELSYDLSFSCSSIETGVCVVEATTGGSPINFDVGCEELAPTSCEYSGYLVITDAYSLNLYTMGWSPPGANPLLTVEGPIEGANPVSLDFSGTVTYTYTPVATPEPESSSLVMAGIGLLLTLRRSLHLRLPPAA